MLSLATTKLSLARSRAPFILSRPFGALATKPFDCRCPSQSPRVAQSPDEISEMLDSLISRVIPSQRSLGTKPSWNLDDPSDTEFLQMMNRNARRPKKANRGARPCSRASRRAKKDKIGKRRR